METWSLNLVMKFMCHSLVFNCAFVVASLNMLIQIMFSMMFGDKSVPKIGGKR